MLFKTTIRVSEVDFYTSVEAKNQADAANKAAVEYFGGDALFVITGEQPICGWVGPINRLPIGGGKLEERVIVKVMKMKKIEEAAVVANVSKKFFDGEMREVGITPTKESRVEYRLKEAAWLKGVVFNNIKEIFIRRWWDKHYGNSYYSMHLVAYLDNTYTMNIPMQYGYGDAYGLIRQAGIVTDDILVREWLEQHNITVVDEGYGRKADMYKSAL